MSGSEEAIEFSHPRLDEVSPSFSMDEGREAAEYHMQRNTELLGAWLKVISLIEQEDLQTGTPTVEGVMSDPKYL